LAISLANRADDNSILSPAAGERQEARRSHFVDLRNALECWQADLRKRRMVGGFIREGFRPGAKTPAARSIAELKTSSIPARK